MGPTYILLVALLCIICSVSPCIGVGATNKVQVVTEMAKVKTMTVKLQATEDEILGGKPMNMTKEPQALVSGLCPKGCSKHGKCHSGKCLCFTGFIGTGCETKHFQGYAIVFNKENFLRVEPLGKENSFTFEAWVRLASLPLPGKPMKILRAGVTVSLDIISHGRVSFSVKNNMPESVVFDAKAAMLKPLVWYHIAVTYSMRHAGRTGTGSSSLYINGKWVQALGYAIESKATNPILLGESKIGEGFAGVMDEVRIYRRALPPREVSHHAAGRLSGNETGLLVYYRFDEGFGNVAADTRLPREGQVRHDAALNGAFTTYVISYAPFETCNLKCSNHGMCLVVESENGFDQHVCKCEQGYDGKHCESQVCPGTPLPCTHPNGYCQRTIMADTPHWKAPNLPPFFVEKANMTRDELLKYKGTLQTGVKEILENASKVVLQAEWEAAHHRAWKCVCKGLWTGDACEKKKCPGDCMNHGVCDDGKCLCNEGWRGTMCSVKLCPNSCSEHGQCVNGTCICDAGYTGEDCAILNQCQNGCSGHGRCVMAECQCDAAYTGDDCSWAASCYNFCSGRGNCVDDVCVCDKLYTGVDCSEPRCPSDCSGRGDCVKGICMCEPGFEGAACEEDIIWPMRCSTQRSGFTSSSSCKRGVEALKIIPQGAQVMQIKFEREKSKASGAYQIFPQDMGNK